MSTLEGRNVLLGVTGGVAAYKAAELCRLLVKAGAAVQVVMTKAACEFVQPLTFAALSRRDVATDLFKEAHHIALARWADAVVVAPATADFIARVAGGRADDLLGTIVLATESPVLLAPAMNPTMLLAQVTQENLARLAARPTFELCESPAGAMAEPEEGPGRLLEPAELLRRVERLLGPRDLRGVGVLVTAGPTREPIDPVRFISNRSSGKMGYALAARAAARGADVTLVSGPTALRPPPRVRLVRVETTAEMRDAVFAALPAAQVLIKAAAPADYRPAAVAAEKIKKGTVGQYLELTPTDDILTLVRERKAPGTVIVGFAAETRDLVANARDKVLRKGLDLCVANEVGQGRAFDVDTNKVTLVDGDGKDTPLPEASKTDVADAVLDRVVALLAQRKTP